MKTTKPLFKQLHEANELVKQKQTEIDELVSCLNIALYGELTVDNEIKFNELIQKHTKK